MARKPGKDLDLTHIAPVAPATPDQTKVEDLAPEEHMEPHEVAARINHGIQPGAVESPLFDEGQLASALAHPSAPPQLLESAYDRFFPSSDPHADASGLAMPDGQMASDMVAAIVKNPNTPHDVVERHIRRSYRGDEDHAWDHPSVQDSLAQDIARSLANQEEERVSGVPNRLTNLHPDFYNELLGSRPIPEPETDTMTDIQRRTNRRVENHDRMFLRGLSNTQKHTPETLQRAVDFFLGEKPYGMDNHQVKGALSDFIQKQKNLSPEQLDRLMDAASDMGDRYAGSAAEDVLDHPNVSPATVARAAVAKGNSYSSQQLREAAMQSPKLPEATRRKLVSKIASSEPSYSDSNIFKNPSLDAQDLSKLYASGRARDAVKHPNATPEMIQDFYDKNKDNLDSMRDMLATSSRIPKDVMMDLVNHKKQDLAVAALSRPEADIDVVNAALKRKAATVRQAAMRNPLVAGDALMNVLKEGSIDGFDFLQPHNVQALGGRVPEQAAHLLDKQYSMKNYDTSAEQAGDYEGKQKFWAVKQYLANHDGIPSDIQAQNAKDIAGHFLNTTKPEDSVSVADDRSSISRQLGSYLISMADKGNPEARAALAQRPGFLQHAKLQDPSYGNDFLKTAAQSFMNSHFDDDGKNQQLSEIASNPNLDQETFDQITLNPSFIGKANNYTASYWSHKKDAEPTIFDQRYKNATPEEKEVGFGKLMNSQAGQKALLASKESPPAMWRTAFQAQTPEEQKEVLSSLNVGTYADPETFKEALAGRYNQPHRGRFGRDSSPQEDAVADLDLSQPDDRNAFYEAVPHMVSGNSTVSPSEIASSMNFKHMPSEDVAQVVQRVFEMDPNNTLAPFVAARAAVDRGTLGESELVGSMNNLSNVPGQMANDALASRWRTLLSNADSSLGTGYSSDKVSSVLRRIAGSQRGDVANGQLDFLADLPDNGLMTEKAIEHGLISPQKIAEISAARPEQVATGLKRMDHASRAELLGNLIDQNKVDMSTIPYLIPILNSGIFTSKNYGTAFNEEMYSNTKNRVFQFADAVAHADAPRAAEAIANTVGRDPEEKKNRMPIDFKKRLVRDYVDHVLNSQLPPNEKYLILGNLQGALGDNNALEYMPVKLRQHLADEAVKQGNVPALAAMIASGQSSPAINERAAEMFNNSQAMSASDMNALAPVIQKVDKSKIRPIFDGMLQKLNAMGPEDERYRVQLAEHVVTAGGYVLSRSSVTSEEVSHYSNVMKAMTHSENPKIASEAAKSLMNAVQNPEIPQDQRSEMFASIPDEHVDPTDLSVVSASFVNAPATVESAVTPNKLRAVMERSSDLKHEQIETISNRAMRMLEEGQIENSDLREMASGLMHNADATSEQLTKVFRAMHWVHQYDAFANGVNGDNVPAIAAAGNVLQDDIQSVLDHKGGVLDQQVTNPATPNHVSSASIRMRAFAQSMERMHGSSGGASEDPRGKEMTSRFVGQLKQFADLALQSKQSGVTEGGHPNDFPMNFANTALKQAPNDYLSAADLESVMHIGTVDKQLATKESSENRDTLAETLPNLIGKFNLSEEELNGFLQRRPETVYAISGRSSVPAGTFMNLDLDGMFRYDLHFGNTLSEMMGKVAFASASEAAPAIQKVVTAYKSNDEFSNHQYSQLFQNMIQRSPHAFDNKSIDAITKALKTRSGVPVKEMTHEIRMQAAKAGSVDASYVTKMLTDKKNWLEDRDVYELANKAHIDDKAFDALIERSLDADRELDLGALAENPRLSEEVVERVVHHIDEEFDRNEDEANQLAETITKNPKISLESLGKLYDRTKGKFGTEFKVGQPFHPALLNPKHGGDLFRQIPVAVPKALNGYDIKNDKLVKKAEYSQGRSRLKQALAVIPAQGIDWATFKKANPRMETWPEVKSMFMAKNNRPVMPEDVAEAIRKADASEFHVTYTSWEGAQRHRSSGNDTTASKNLVVQLNTTKSMEEKMASNPKLLAFFQFVQNSANRTADGQVGGHPVTPHIASWVRVDVGAAREGWIIEEQQSDFSQRLHQEIDALAKNNPTGLSIGEHQVTPDEMHQFNDQIAEIIKGWYQAGFEAVEQLARNHKVKALYLHGLEPRAQLSGFSADKPYPVYIKEMYDKYPRANGWSETTYDEYPIKSNTFSELLNNRPNKKCWVKKLK